MQDEINDIVVSIETTLAEEKLSDQLKNVLKESLNEIKSLRMALQMFSEELERIEQESDGVSI